MIKEMLISAYLSIVPVTRMETPQISMPDLTGLEEKIGESFDCSDRNNTIITMKKYFKYHSEPECMGHLKYITATRKGIDKPYCIYDGINYIMYLDNGKKMGLPEDGWMDNAFKCLPGEVDAMILIPKLKEA